MPPISLDAFLKLSREKNFFAAVIALEESGTPEEVGKAFEELHLDAYWKRIDLPLAALLLHAGILFCLGRAKLEVDVALQNKMRSTAKGLAYNLASFTWPGWDEPEMRPTSDQMAMGLEAARLNLQLAIELEKPPERLRDAHWLLGAQMLAKGDIRNAREEFKMAVSEAADEHYGLHNGYVLLTGVLLREEGAGVKWDGHMTGLAAADTENGKFAHAQLMTAFHVFVSRKNFLGGADKS
ncbi:MAG TPA: hypothetical protein VGN88_08285 [Phycisphaerae bacterium]